MAISIVLTVLSLHKLQCYMRSSVKECSPGYPQNREFQGTLFLRSRDMSKDPHVNLWSFVIPEVRVVGLPQCGMFMDQPDYKGKPFYTPLYANIFNLMGAWVWNSKEYP